MLCVVQGAARLVLPRRDTRAAPAPFLPSRLSLIIGQRMVHCEFGQDRLAQPPLQAFELAERSKPRKAKCSDSKDLLEFVLQFRPRVIGLHPCWSDDHAAESHPLRPYFFSRFIQLT